MNELVAIVEGETEQSFFRDQVAGHLALHGTSAWPVLFGRKRDSGGIKKWETARMDIQRTLKEGRYCTTMVDYYAMPYDWPGRRDAESKPWNERAATVEAEIKKNILQTMGGKFDPKFFIPYVQLHEFEALTFAEVGHLASVVAPLSKSSEESLKSYFQEILEEAGHPEAINDGFETCPSRRISRLVPAYSKRVQGPIITLRIGLETLRERCDHFARWIDRLEKVSEMA